jgi:hypothetical protein
MERPRLRDPVEQERKPVADGRLVDHAGHRDRLPVERGVWYYRVRGLNPSLPKKPEMTWSSPVRLRVAGPRFRIVRR